MASLVDAVLASAWLASVVVAWGRPGRRPGGAFLAGIGLGAAVLALGLQVERATGGPLWRAPLATAIGVALAACGTVLHARARAALGRSWSPLATPSGERLVTHGPYARLRHPAYAGLVVLALGTVLAHPSVAVTVAASGLTVGLVLKSRAEDARLEARFGGAWRRWAADVRGWWPCALRRDRPR